MSSIPPIESYPTIDNVKKYLPSAMLEWVNTLNIPVNVPLEWDFQTIIERDYLKEAVENSPYKCFKPTENKVVRITYNETTYTQTFKIINGRWQLAPEDVR